MSARLLNAALEMQSGCTTAEKLVIVVLAWRADEGGICWPSVVSIARQTGLTRRTVIRCLASLSRKGLVRREPMRKPHGVGWRHIVMLPASATGDTMSPVDPVNRCHHVTPTGDTMSPKRQLKDNTSPPPLQCNAVAGGGGVEMSRDIVLCIAEAEKMPADFAEETADAWEASGWTTANGIPITPKNARKILRGWWRKDWRRGT